MHCNEKKRYGKVKCLEIGRDKSEFEEDKVDKMQVRSARKESNDGGINKKNGSYEGCSKRDPYQVLSSGLRKATAQEVREKS